MSAEETDSVTNKPKRGSGPLAKATIALAGLAAVLGALALVRGYSAQAPNEVAAQELLAVEVSAATLATAYAVDPRAAQKLYGAEPLAVTGVIAGLQSDAKGARRIQLRGAGDDHVIRAMMSATAADGGPMLLQGLTITLRCRSVVVRDGAPVLQQCNP